MAKVENKYIRTTNGNTMEYLYENVRLRAREMIHITPEWSEVTADQANGAYGNHPSVIEVREEVVDEETVDLQDGDLVHEDPSVEEEDAVHSGQISQVRVHDHELEGTEIEEMFREKGAVHEEDAVQEEDAAHEEDRPKRGRRNRG